jgi:predicted membrane protein
MPGARLRNQRTAALIRRDVIWQIGLPLGIAILIVLVIMVYFIAGLLFNFPAVAPAGSLWADIALIVLIIPTALMALVVLALIGGLVYLMIRLLREVPYYAKKAQDFVALATYRVNNMAAKITNVVLSIRSFWAGVRKAAADVRAYLPARRSG